MNDEELQEIENKAYDCSSEHEMTEVIWTPKIRFWFIFQLGVKIVMEMIFIYLYYILQKQQSKQVSLNFW